MYVCDGCKKAWFPLNLHHITETKEASLLIQQNKSFVCVCVCVSPFTWWIQTSPIKNLFLSPFPVLNPHLFLIYFPSFFSFPPVSFLFLIPTGHLKQQLLWEEIQLAGESFRLIIATQSRSVFLSQKSFRRISTLV